MHGSRSCGSCSKCADVFSLRKIFREIFFTASQIFYFCSMENILTPAKAWEDFYAWVLDPANGIVISPDNKHYLQKTDLDMKAGRCGNARLRNAFERYAPGRYTFVDRSGFVPVIPKLVIPTCARCGGSGFDPYQGHTTTMAVCPECFQGNGGAPVLPALTVNN